MHRHLCQLLDGRGLIPHSQEGKLEIKSLMVKPGPAIKRVAERAFEILKFGCRGSWEVGKKLNHKAAREISWLNDARTGGRKDAFSQGVFYMTP